MTMHRRITRGVKLAIRQRLLLLLEEETTNYESWKDRIRPRLKKTRSDQVERAFKKRIQAIRIVIYILTPREMRDSDMPGMWER